MLFYRHSWTYFTKRTKYSCQLWCLVWLLRNVMDYFLQINSISQLYFCHFMKHECHVPAILEEFPGELTTPVLFMDVPLSGYCCFCIKWSCIEDSTCFSWSDWNGFFGYIIGSCLLVLNWFVIVESLDCGGDNLSCLRGWYTRALVFTGLTFLHQPQVDNTNYCCYYKISFSLLWFKLIMPRVCDGLWLYRLRYGTIGVTVDSNYNGKVLALLLTQFLVYSCYHICLIMFCLFFMFVSRLWVRFLELAGYKFYYYITLPYRW